MKYLQSNASLHTREVDRKSSSVYHPRESEETTSWDISEYKLTHIGIGRGCHPLQRSMSRMEGEMTSVTLRKKIRGINLKSSKPRLSHL